MSDKTHCERHEIYFTSPDCPMCKIVGTIGTQYLADLRRCEKHDYPIYFDKDDIDGTKETCPLCHGGGGAPDPKTIELRKKERELESKGDHGRPNDVGYRWL